MKKLFFAFALLLSTTAFAQGPSFKLKTGSKLVYMITEGEKETEMVIVIESASPLKFNYTVNGVKKTSTGPIVFKGTEIPLLLPVAYFKGIKQLEQKWKDNPDVYDTSSTPINFKGLGDMRFKDIGFQRESVTYNSEEDFGLHTYYVNMPTPGSDENVDYVLRVNRDSEMPMITFFADNKADYTIRLRQVTGVEDYDPME